MMPRSHKIEALFKILVGFQLLCSTCFVGIIFPVLNRIADDNYATPSCPDYTPFDSVYDCLDENYSCARGPGLEACSVEVREIYLPRWLILAPIFAIGAFVSAVAIWLPGFSLWLNEKGNSTQMKICRISVISFLALIVLLFLLLLFSYLIAKILPGPYYPA